ncbi:MAG TPA: hypothetical protein VFN76_02030, partial [Candidatus Limnocylindria bacterium]|nr:hypothetical protein [Candidatus Limnocylindria bacterium]
MEDVEHQVADADLLVLREIAGRSDRFHLEAVGVSSVEPIGVVGMDREGRIGRPHQGAVVEDVVDVPVGV